MSARLLEALCTHFEFTHTYCNLKITPNTQAMFGGGSAPFLVLRVRRGPHLLRVSHQSNFVQNSMAAGLCFLLFAVMWLVRACLQDSC